MISLWPPIGSSRFSSTVAVITPSLANARWRIFSQQELNSCWMLFFTDRQASMHQSSSTLAHLHACSTRCAYFTHSSPPLLASASQRIFALCFSQGQYGLDVSLLCRRLPSDVWLLVPFLPLFFLLFRHTTTADCL